MSDAKGDVDDRVRDLAASERELEKADFDLRYKTHEAKIVNKAAVAKRTEVGEVLPTGLLLADCAFALVQSSAQHRDEVDCKIEYLNSTAMSMNWCCSAARNSMYHGVFTAEAELLCKTSDGLFSDVGQVERLPGKFGDVVYKLKPHVKYVHLGQQYVKCVELANQNCRFRTTIKNLDSESASVRV